MQVALPATLSRTAVPPWSAGAGGHRELRRPVRARRVARLGWLPHPARSMGQSGRMTDQVRVVAILRAQPAKGAAVLELWPALSAQVRAEDGCLAYELHRVAGDEDRFVVLERWASVGALATHGRSDHMREFGRTARDLMAAPAEVIVLEDEPAV